MTNKKRPVAGNVHAYVLVKSRAYPPRQRTSAVKDRDGHPLQPQSKQTFFWVAVEVDR